MQEEKVYNFLIILIILAIAFVLLLIFFPSADYYTELYFENPTDLPYIIELNTEYTFSFSIHNLEQETLIYDYEVILIIDNNENILNLSEIPLNNGEKVTITESFAINGSFETAKILVKTNNKEIYFWVVEE